MKLDILAFGAHPDDVEISAGGTLLKYISEGKKVGIVDLTKGELGTRGSAELRTEEAKKARKEALARMKREVLETGGAMKEAHLKREEDIGMILPALGEYY